MKITIYTNENCVACERTKKAFDTAGVEYETKMLSDHPDALSEFIEKGYREAPIVITDNDEWSGFKLDKIKQTAMAKK